MEFCSRSNDLVCLNYVFHLDNEYHSIWPHCHKVSGTWKSPAARYAPRLKRLKTDAVAPSLDPILLRDFPENDDIDIVEHLGFVVKVLEQALQVELKLDYYLLRLPSCIQVIAPLIARDERDHILEFTSPNLFKEHRDNCCFLVVWPFLEGCLGGVEVRQIRDFFEGLLPITHAFENVRPCAEIFLNVAEVPIECFVCDIPKRALLSSMDRLSPDVEAQRRIVNQNEEVRQVSNYAWIADFGRISC